MLGYFIPDTTVLNLRLWAQIYNNLRNGEQFSAIFSDWGCFFPIKENKKKSVSAHADRHRHTLRGTHPTDAPRATPVYNKIIPTHPPAGRPPCGSPTR